MNKSVDLRAGAESAFNEFVSRYRPNDITQPVLVLEQNLVDNLSLHFSTLWFNKNSLVEVARTTGPESEVLGSISL